MGFTLYVLLTAVLSVSFFTLGATSMKLAYKEANVSSPVSFDGLGSCPPAPRRGGGFRAHFEPWNRGIYSH